MFNKCKPGCSFANQNMHLLLKYTVLYKQQIKIPYFLRAVWPFVTRAFFFPGSVIAWRGTWTTTWCASTPCPHAGSGARRNSTAAKTYCVRSTRLTWDSSRTRWWPASLLGKVGALWIIWGTLCFVGEFVTLQSLLCQQHLWQPRNLMCNSVFFIWCKAISIKSFEEKKAHFFRWLDRYTRAGKWFQNGYQNGCSNLPHNSIEVALERVAKMDVRLSAMMCRSIAWQTYCSLTSLIHQL